jgi:hypothetical protein
MEGLSDWLQSFLTSEIRAQLKNEPCISTNWIYCWFSEIKKEAVSDFEHLGEEYCIYKVKNRHKYCGCEWIEYYAGLKDMDDYDGYIKHFGSSYDNSVIGACCGESEAVHLVTDALKNIYPGKHSLSRVCKAYGMAYERKMNYRQAAEYLIGGNYDREHISAIIEAEKSSRSFYNGYAAIKKDYPDIVLDYRFIV